MSPGKWDAQTSLRFSDTNGSPNFGLTTSSSNNKQKKKKRTCRIVDFALPVDYSGKFKKGEKKYKYLDLAREQKKLWNMKVTVTPILNSALGTVTKGLVEWQEDLEIRGWVETIQTTAYQVRSEYREESWRFAVTQTPVRNHQLTLVRKTL